MENSARTATDAKLESEEKKLKSMLFLMRSNSVRYSGILKNIKD